MKRNELKKVLKPLIKECIKECIFEEGVLSGIITEVAKGFESKRLVTERTNTKNNDVDDRRELEEKYERDRQKRIKILNENHSVPAHPVKASSSTSSAHGPMSGVSPSDPGVNIDGLLDLVGTKWRKMV